MSFFFFFIYIDKLLQHFFFLFFAFPMKKKHFGRFLFFSFPACREPSVGHLHFGLQALDLLGRPRRIFCVHGKTLCAFWKERNEREERVLALCTC